MANWCDNMVVFKGDPERVQLVIDLFMGLIALEQSSGFGQLPDFVDEPEGYFFELKVDGKAFCYITRWLPNVGAVKLIADHFKVDFIHRYWETGCHIIGIDIYKNGLLSSTPLMSPMLLEEDEFQEQEEFVDQLCRDAFSE